MMGIPLRWLAAGTLLTAGLGALVAPGRRARVAEAAATDTSITSRSIAYFEKRLAANPANYMVQGRLINRYVLRFGTGADLGDVTRAEALARDLVRTGPERSQALDRLSSVLLMQHKFAESLASAQEALTIDSLDQDAIGAVFDAALASGRYDDAEAALGRLRPGSLGAQVRRAQWLDASGRSDGAYDALDQVCRQLERSATRPAIIAWCLTQLGNVQHARLGPEAATLLWRRALKVQPGYRGALEGLAGLASARGQWAKAAELYVRIAADAHPDLYLRLAEALRAQSAPGAAERHERRFLAVAGQPANEPLFGEVLALYYTEHSTRESLDTALALAQRDVKRRPTIESYDVLSWVRFMRGELVEALAASDQARRWGTPSPTMDYHRARILEAMGRTREAAILFRRASAWPTLLAPHARFDRAHRLSSGETGERGT